MTDSSRTFGLGSLLDRAEYSPESIVDLGPDHPSNAGLLTADVALTDGRVERLDVHPGVMHRGAEMLFEVRDYRQILSLANRHDWEAPVFGELAVATLVERELGIEIPPRAAWIRTLLAEHHRVISHLAFLSFVGHRLGLEHLATSQLREDLRLRNLELTGNRLHPMAVRVGGVAVDPSPAWLDALRATHAAASALAGRIASTLQECGLGRDIGLLTADQVSAYGVSGSAARASGVPEDLRRDRPSLAYPELTGLLAAPEAPTRGDAASRFAWWAAEVVQSGLLIGRCAEVMPGGEVTVRLPKVIKLPEGDSYVEVEAPLGRAGVFVVSRGDKTPWRLRLRTPSLANVSAWESACRGLTWDELPVAIASLGYVTGDLDK